ncbi:hypothetical protein E4P40_05230 [Blastococcus sp. CT_GayMR20]|uniref:hypothetical protein n=1 Tax=Blastococcus sp. CT_GayMR20 TaxID=2559609 RepID=UPI0010741C09|nr:hypothetical protein [Blastococcus sp. CT_GayMR20]TFV91711.1 hypothetical protein E4P40_05230 [Blastococcus sp. CT_GayMR20]
MRGGDGRQSESASLIAARQLAEEADQGRRPAGPRRRRRPLVVPPPLLPPPDEPAPDAEPEWDPSS